jgi:hypothetical protein
MASDPVLSAIYAAADQNGVPRSLAVAIARVESGLNPRAVGDGGTSFGLYQLHQGGELGSLTPAQAFDPYTNASVSLRQVGAVLRQHPNADPGVIAAMAQRPANQGAYARAVDNVLGTPTPQAAAGATVGNLPATAQLASATDGGGGTNCAQWGWWDPRRWVCDGGQIGSSAFGVVIGPLNRIAATISAGVILFSALGMFLVGVILASGLPLVGGHRLPGFLLMGFAALLAFWTFHG